MTSDSEPTLVDFGLNDSYLSIFCFIMLLSCNQWADIDDFGHVHSSSQFG